MKIIKYIDSGVFAREDIKEGDLISCVYKRFARKSKNTDVRILGFCIKDFKKGEEVEWIVPFGESGLILQNCV